MKRVKVGAITFCIVFLLNQLFSFFPLLYEWVYLGFFFQAVRLIHDFTLGLLPIPSLYLVVPVFFGYFFRNSFTSLKSFLISLLNCFIWIINLFYILWAFNYHQPALKEQLDLPDVTVDSNYIKSAFLEQALVVNRLASDTITPLSYKESEELIRLTQEKLLKEWGMPVPGRMRVRKLPGGSLLHFRSTGIYIPHAAEGHIDGGMYEKQYPFTLAHEMAHGYGFTDESVCNFIAYLTCLLSDEPYMRYSAELAYWRYLAVYYRRNNPEGYEQVLNNMVPRVQKDLAAIRRHISRYRDWMPRYRDRIYDSYLKRHGVSAGLQSYSQMIYLIASYRHQPQTIHPQRSY